MYQKLLESIKEHSSLDPEQIIEAGIHGADCGWSGFTYNSDCIDYFDNNSELIQDFMQDYAEDMGYGNWLELMTTFRRNDMLSFSDGYKILASWFILEIVGQWLEARESINSGLKEAI